MRLNLTALSPICQLLFATNFNVFI